MTTATLLHRIPNTLLQRCAPTVYRKRSSTSWDVISPVRQLRRGPRVKVVLAAYVDRRTIEPLFQNLSKQSLLTSECIVRLICDRLHHRGSRLLRVWVKQKLPDLSSLLHRLVDGCREPASSQLRQRRHFFAVVSILDLVHCSSLHFRQKHRVDCPCNALNTLLAPLWLYQHSNKFLLDIPLHTKAKVSRFAATDLSLLSFPGFTPTCIAKLAMQDMRHSLTSHGPPPSAIMSLVFTYMDRSKEFFDTVYAEEDAIYLVFEAFKRLLKHSPHCPQPLRDTFLGFLADGFNQPTTRLRSLIMLIRHGLFTTCSTLMDSHQPVPRHLQRLIFKTLVPNLCRLPVLIATRRALRNLCRDDPEGFGQNWLLMSLKTHADRKASVCGRSEHCNAVRATISSTRPSS